MAKIVQNQLLTLQHQLFFFFFTCSVTVPPIGANLMCSGHLSSFFALYCQSPLHVVHMFSYRIGEIKQSSVHAFQERAAAAFTSIGTLLSGEPALQDVPISLIIHAEFFYCALHVNCKGKQHLPTPSHTCFSRFCLLQKRVTLKLPSKLVKRNSLEKVQVVSSSLFRFNNGKEK